MVSVTLCVVNMLVGTDDGDGLNVADVIVDACGFAVEVTKVEVGSGVNACIVEVLPIVVDEINDNEDWVVFDVE